MMTKVNPLVVIDAALPIGLVDIDDVMDNHHWKFCSDDPMADESTYTEFEMAPDAIIPAGTTVRIDGLWGWLDKGGLSDSTDYEITVPVDATVNHVTHVLLSRYHGDLLAAGGMGRFLFIEQVSMVNGRVEIVWGS